MRSNLRVIAGFFLAPVLPCTFAGLLPALIVGHAAQALVIIVPMILVSLALIIVLCVPAYLVLCRYWRVGLLECLAAGVTAALLLNVALYIFSTIAFSGGGYSAADSGGPTYIDGQLTMHGWWVALLGLAAHALLGASIGFCFWFIAFWRVSMLKLKSV